jgi:hypothetical protein
MRSSEFAWPRLAGLWLTALLSVACSTLPQREGEGPATSAAAGPTVGNCTVAGAAMAPSRAAAADAFRRSIEGGPLYASAIRAVPRRDCRIEAEAGALTLHYSADGGNRLVATRDEAIEHTEQAVFFARAPIEDPVVTLKRAELATFGEKGCGIDWQAPEAGKPDGAMLLSDSIYRGRACNCQARVRRDTRGEVAGLLFRSTC